MQQIRLLRSVYCHPGVINVGYPRSTIVWEVIDTMWFMRLVESMLATPHPSHLLYKRSASATSNASWVSASCAHPAVTLGVRPLWSLAGKVEGAGQLFRSAVCGRYVIAIRRPQMAT